MLTIIIALFVVAAIIGLTLAIALFRKKETSKPVALTHGLFGAGGLIFLAVYTAQNPDRLLWTAVALLAVAALGGLWLFSNDLRRKPGPHALIVIHALAALVAVGLVVAVAVS